MEFPSDQEAKGQLLSKRQLAIFGEIDGKSDDYIRDGLLWLNSMSPTEPILLWIDSPGGQTIPALSIYDRICISPAPVYGLVTYMAASSASLILQACRIRAILSHSRIHLHGVTYREVPLQLFLEEPAKFTDEWKRIQDFVFQVYVTRSGRSREEIEKLSKEEKPLYADQALELGLVDRVLGTREEFKTLLAEQVATAS